MKKTLAALALTLPLLGLSSLAQPPNKPTVQTETEATHLGTPISGIEVTLEQASGAVIKTVRTDAAGKFEFNDLRPGIYIIKSGYTIQSPRDHATGQASGKQAHSAGATTAAVVSPRDVATGQASGKRDSEAGTANNNATTNAEANRTGVNTSRSNIKNQRVAAEVILGDDDPAPSAKAGISTSRSNIRTKQGINAPETDENVLAVQLFSDDTPSSKRAFVLPHVLEKAGLTVEVTANGRLVGNVLKTRHDTVKNSINNVR